MYSEDMCVYEDIYEYYCEHSLVNLCTDIVLMIGVLK